MTLLRRISQLVQDLRTLEVLDEKDEVDFKQDGESIELTINLDILAFRMSMQPVDIVQNTIENTIYSEFVDKKIDIERFWTGRIVVSIKSNV